MTACRTRRNRQQAKKRDMLQKYQPCYSLSETRLQRATVALIEDRQYTSQSPLMSSLAAHPAKQSICNLPYGENYSCRHSVCSLNDCHSCRVHHAGHSHAAARQQTLIHCARNTMQGIASTVCSFNKTRSSTPMPKFERSGLHQHRAVVLPFAA